MPITRAQPAGITNYTVCTSGTRPTGVTEGALICETDTDTILIYDGGSWIEIAGHGAWKTFTTAWNGTIGNGAIASAYRRYGRTIHYRIDILWGTTTTVPAANQQVTLPFAPAPGYPANVPLGSVYSALDSSAGQVWNGQMISVPGQTVIFFGGGISYAGGTSGVITNAVPMTWANLDRLHVNGTYEAVS